MREREKKKKKKWTLYFDAYTADAAHNSNWLLRWTEWDKQKQHTFSTDMFSDTNHVHCVLVCEEKKADNV